MSKSVLKIWGRKFELNVIYECYPGEKVLDIQREELEMLMYEDDIDTALENVKEYVAKNSEGQAALPIENIFKYVMPKCIFIPHSSKSPIAAIMCSYKFDIENGIAVVFEKGRYKEVVSEDAVR